MSITQSDLDTIPPLRQLRQTIGEWEHALRRTSGKEAYLIKKALIEMRKDQYIIKSAYQKPIVFKTIARTEPPNPPLEDKSWLDITPTGPVVRIEGVSFMNPQVVSAVLCNYSQLREDAWGNFSNDLWAFMETFDEIAGRALCGHPIYECLVTLKVDGL